MLLNFNKLLNTVGREHKIDKKTSTFPRQIPQETFIKKQDNIMLILENI